MQVSIAAQLLIIGMGVRSKSSHPPHRHDKVAKAGVYPPGDEIPMILGYTVRAKACPLSAGFFLWKTFCLAVEAFVEFGRVSSGPATGRRRPGHHAGTTCGLYRGGIL